MSLAGPADRLGRDEADRKDRGRGPQPNIGLDIGDGIGATLDCAKAATSASRPVAAKAPGPNPRNSVARAI